MVYTLTITRFHPVEGAHTWAELKKFSDVQISDEVKQIFATARLLVLVNCLLTMLDVSLLPAFA